MNPNLRGNTKWKFMREQSKENLFNILYCLRDSYVWIPATYNLTPEQEAQLQKMQKGIKAGEGEGIVFQPDILMDGDSAFLPVFTNEDQVIEEYGETMDVADSNAQLTGIVIDAFTVPFTVIKKNFNMIRTLPSNMENGGIQVKPRQ